MGFEVAERGASSNESGAGACTEKGEIGWGYRFAAA